MSDFAEAQLVNDVVVPPPIVFDLSAAQSVQIRKKRLGLNGMGLLAPVLATNIILQLISGVVHLYRHDPFGWLSVGTAVLMAGAGLTFWRSQAFFTRSDVATTVTFSNAGVSIERGPASSRRTRFVAFNRIRWAQMTPDALILSMNFAGCYMIPKSAMVDDGLPLMRFLEEHMVGRYALRRMPGSTLITNTMSP